MLIQIPFSAIKEGNNALLRAQKESWPLSAKIYINFPIFDSIVECAPIESECISNQNRARTSIYVSEHTYLRYYLLCGRFQIAPKHLGWEAEGRSAEGNVCVSWARFLLADHQKRERIVMAEKKVDPKLPWWSSGEKTFIGFVWCESFVHSPHLPYLQCRKLPLQFAPNDNKLSHTITLVGRKIVSRLAGHRFGLDCWQTITSGKKPGWSENSF